MSQKRPTFGLLQLWHTWTDFDVFGRDVTDKVSNQKTLAMTPQIPCASALPCKTGNTKIAFFTLCISALPEFNQLLLVFCNLFDSQLILTLLYDSLNLAINAFSFVLLGGMVSLQEKGSRERCSSLTVLHAQSTSGLSSGFPLSQGNAEALDRSKQSTVWYLTFYVWYLTFSVPFLPKIIATGSCTSRL